MTRIYLDHAATTLLDPRVKEAMDAFLEYEYGNPSALYQEGLIAKQAVDIARSTISRTLNAHPDEIIFTGSGTESDNLAIQGVVNAYQKENEAALPHIITSQIEHPAVLSTVQALESAGQIQATYIGVHERGIIDPKDIAEALTETTILVSIMQVNSEIGTIQPIRDIVKVVRDYRKKKGIDKDTVGYPYVHTDACQAFNYLDSNMQKLGVDMYTYNGSKIYGPKGVGVLYKRRGVVIEPIIYGGGQEGSLRSGTENVAGIVGMGVASSIALEKRADEGERLSTLRDFFIREVLKVFPGSRLNGDEKVRSPNNINISVLDVEEDMIVIDLDARGIACSSKSACKSGIGDESHVVAALGTAGENESTVRFTLGRSTTKEDLEETVRALEEFLDRMRKLN